MMMNYFFQSSANSLLVPSTTASSNTKTSSTGGIGRVARSVLVIFVLLAGIIADHIVLAEWEKNDDCFDVSASCITSDGIPCKYIFQQRSSSSCNRNNRNNNNKSTNALSANIDIKVCNRNGVSHNIEADGAFLRITGPAAIGSGDDIIVSYGETGMANPLLPTTSRDENCQTFSFDNLSIDTCRSHFNYQVNAISADVKNGAECRGFLFERNMISSCWVDTKIECKITNSMDGTVTLCQDFKPKSRDDCIQNIEYNFSWENKSKYLLDPNASNSFVKVAGQELAMTGDLFQKLVKTGERVNFVHVQSSFNICNNHNTIPSAEIKVDAEIIPQDATEKKLLDGNYIQECTDRGLYPAIVVTIPDPRPPPTQSPTRSTNISKGNPSGKGGSGKRKKRFVRNLA